MTGSETSTKNPRPNMRKLTIAKSVNNPTLTRESVDERFFDDDFLNAAPMAKMALSFGTAHAPVHFE